eukprot:1497747-Prymnesium_polylepis.1
MSAGKSGTWKVCPIVNQRPVGCGWACDVPRAWTSIEALCGIGGVELVVVGLDRPTFLQPQPMGMPCMTAAPWPRGIQTTTASYAARASAPSSRGAGAPRDEPRRADCRPRAARAGGIGCVPERRAEHRRPVLDRGLLGRGGRTARGERYGRSQAHQR